MHFDNLWSYSQALKEAKEEKVERPVVENPRKLPRVDLSEQVFRYVFFFISLVDLIISKLIFAYS